MRTRTDRSQRGAALLTAMVIVTLVATMAAAMVWQQWRAVQVETAERARMQSSWILQGALDWARLILREDARSGRPTALTEPWATPLAEARLSTFLAADKNNNAEDDGPEEMVRERREVILGHALCQVVLTLEVSTDRVPDVLPERGQPVLARVLDVALPHIGTLEERNAVLDRRVEDLLDGVGVRAHHTTLPRNAACHDGAGQRAKNSGAGPSGHDSQNCSQSIITSGMGLTRSRATASARMDSRVK